MGIFCCRKCYGIYRKKNKDILNKSTKISVICDNCGKNFKKVPSNLNNKNKDGETHNFCCYECYWNFRKTYYRGNKLYNTGKKMDDSFCNKVREATLRQYATGVLNRQTKPQILVNSILSKNNINYINEKTFKYYSVDNFIYDNNLIIEVMGDYFHANPLKYNNYDTLKDMQKKDIIRDRRKRTYIEKYYNIKILYIWENDLKYNQNLCENLILRYINSNGILDNYNSFNYHLENNDLILNSTIVNPYFIITP